MLDLKRVRDGTTVAYPRHRVTAKMTNYHWLQSANHERCDTVAEAITAMGWATVDQEMRSFKWRRSFRCSSRVFTAIDRDI